MDNIYTKFTCRLIDEHLASDIDQLTENDHICDMSDMQAIVCQILEKQKAGNYILVVTDSPDICNLVLAFNPTLKDHKISVLCNDVLHADDAIAELERLEKLLHTESGIEYYPEREIEDGLFEADNDHLLLKNTSINMKSDEKNQFLYSSDGQLWGYVLPYTAASLIGKFNEHIESMSLAERVMLAFDFLTCFKEECLSDSIIIFKTETGLRIYPIGSPNICSTKDLFLLLYELFFGHAPLKDRMLSLIKDRMAHPEYPASLFELFECSFANKIYPGVSCKAATADFCENTLQRLTWSITKEV